MGFVVSPLLVGGLGAFGFGAWEVMRRLVGQLTPVSGRPTQALKWTLARKQASTDWDAKRSHVGASLVVALVFLPVTLGLGAVFAWYAPYWLDAPASWFSELRMAAAILVGSIILTALTTFPRSVLEGENLGYKRMGLSAGVVLAGGGLVMLALELGYGLVGVAVATALTSLMSGILFLTVVRRYVPWFGVARPSPATIRRFFALSGWFLVWNVTMRLMGGADVLLLGIADSAQLVTTYTLSRYVPEAGGYLVTLAILGASPGLGGLLGSGDLEKVRRLREEILTLVWFATTVIGACVLLLNRAFLGLWVETTYYAGPIPMLLIVLMATQLAFVRSDANIIDLTLEIRHKVLLGVASLMVSVALGMVLVGYFDAGIAGVCAGFLAGRSLMSVGYPWRVGRLLGIPLGRQLRSTVRPAFVAVVLLTGSLAIGPLVASLTWFSLVGAGVLALAAVGTLAAYGGLSLRQRRRLLARLKAIGTSLARR